MDYKKFEKRFDEVDKAMQKVEPKSDDYGVLLGRVKSLKDLIKDEEARKFDEDLKLQKLKHEQAMELKRMKDENEIARYKIDSEERLEMERINMELYIEEMHAEEAKKDRRVKLGLGIGGITVGLLSVFADQTHVISKPAQDTFDKVVKWIK